MLSALRSAGDGVNTLALVFCGQQLAFGFAWNVLIYVALGSVLALEDAAGEAERRREPSAGGGRGMNAFSLEREDMAMMADFTTT